MVSFSLAPVMSQPPVTRGLVFMLVLLSGLRFALRYADNAADAGSFTVPGAFPWLELVPGTVLWYPWTLLTAAFVEPNIIEFIVSVLTLALGGRYLERVWGQIELLKFVIVVAVASNLVSTVVNVLESIVLGNKALFLYGMTYRGMMGVQTGFLVAFTQIIPEHQVQLLGGLVKMRVKSLPMLYVTVSNVACLIGFQSPYILIQFGWLVSWAYLRFFKYNEGVEWRGDRSETFAFASWFPPFAQRIVVPLTNFVFDLLVKFRVLPAWNSTDMEAGMGLLGTSSTNHTVPGGARAEAERRRAMALKALDQRMSASKPATPSMSATATLGDPTVAGKAAGPSAVPMQTSSSAPLSSSTSAGGPALANGNADSAAD